MTSETKKNEKKSRTDQLRFLSRSTQIEETTLPVIARVTMLAISGAIIACLVLFSVANINEIARTEGAVEPLGLQRDIQHPTGGIVTKLHVSDGAEVVLGQPIITLSNSDLERDLARAKHRSHTLRVQMETFRAYLEDDTDRVMALASSDKQVALTAVNARRTALLDQLAVVEEQQNQKRKALEILRKQLTQKCQQAKVAKSVLEKRKLLRNQGHITNSELINAEQALIALQSEIAIIEAQIEGAISADSEYRARLASIHSNDRWQAVQAHDAIVAQLSENEELVAKLNAQLEGLVVRATVDGVLNGMSVASVGGLIRPASTITKIVPSDEPLVVRVRVHPRDIGRLSVGSEVQLRFKAYDFERYGGIAGVVETISAASFLDADGGLYFTAQIQPERSYIGQDADRFPIRVGMTVAAQIITGQRTVLEYLMQPIHTALSTAMTEN